MANKILFQLKKKTFGAIAVFAIVAAFNVSLNMNETEMSQLSLANVEALAQYETPKVYYCEQESDFDARKGKCWYGSINATYDYKIAIYSCGEGKTKKSCVEGIYASGNTCDMELHDTPFKIVCQ